MQSTEFHRAQLRWPQAGAFLLGLSFPICDMGLSAWTGTSGALSGAPCGGRLVLLGGWGRGSVKHVV